MKRIAIICPITSKGFEHSISDQPILHALLPSMEALQLWGDCKLFLGYDSDDPMWQQSIKRSQATREAEWVPLYGLRGKITSIWNALSEYVRDYRYVIAANDDMAFQTTPLPATGVIDSQNGLGTCAFRDKAFPDLPTFYMVGNLHFEIFGCLYPLPWEGAHQDPWIADVYRPWKASQIDEQIQVHNRIGAPDSPVTEPRFEYGHATGYRDAVLRGRHKVNEYLRAHPAIAEPLPDSTLDESPMLL